MAVSNRFERFLALAQVDPCTGLGQIVATGRPADGMLIGGNPIGQGAIYSFNRLSLDDAASLIPGVTPANTGGSQRAADLRARLEPLPSAADR